MAAKPHAVEDLDCNICVEVIKILTPKLVKNIEGEIISVCEEACSRDLLGRDTLHREQSNTAKAREFLRSVSSRIDLSGAKYYYQIVDVLKKCDLKHVVQAIEEEVEKRSSQLTPEPVSTAAESGIYTNDNTRETLADELDSYHIDDPYQNTTENQDLTLPLESEPQTREDLIVFSQQSTQSPKEDTSELNRPIQQNSGVEESTLDQSSNLVNIFHLAQSFKVMTIESELQDTKRRLKDIEGEKLKQNENFEEEMKKKERELKKKKEEIAELKKDRESKINELEKEHQQTLERLKDELEIKTQKVQQLESNLKESVEQQERSESEKLKVIEDEKQRHDREMEKLKREYKQKIDDLKESKERKKREINELQQENLRLKLEEQLRIREKSLEKELEREKHNSIIKDMERKHEIEIKESKLRHEIEMKESDWKHEIEMKESKLRHEIEMKESEWKHEKEMKDAQHKLEIQ